jgi:hypothetical protein
MAKMTLLEVTQEILSDMTSDPVNSISDTVEAMQVATIVKRTFLNLVNDRIWPATGRLFRLTSSGDAARPTHMRIEEDVVEVHWVKYDTRDEATKPIGYTDILYKNPHDFLEWTMARDAGASNMATVIDYHGTPLIIQTDRAPTYYTSFDDEYLVFDSYDSDMDSTLQHSKTQVFGIVEPEWRMEDDFVPAMPAKYFPYLVNEAKSTAFIKIKEVFSQKDEQNAQRQKGWLGQNKRRLGYDGRPDFGRKARGSGRYSRAGYRNNQFTG